MGFLRAALWTVCCVALGVGLATQEVGGKTPLEHLRGAWRQSDATDKLQKLKGSASDKLSQSREKLVAVSEKPLEKISAAERNALNQLIDQKKK